MSAINQSIVILKKNFLISFRERDYITELAFPIVGIILAIVTRAVGEDDPTDPATAQLAQFTVILLGMSIIGVIRTLIFNFVAEKEERFKETQKIMGAKSTSYIMGWIATSTIKVTIIAILYVSIVGISGGFQGAKCSFGAILLSFLFYAYASVAQTFFFSTLFSKAKLALDVTFLIQFFASMMFNLAAVDSIGGNKIMLCMFSIFPQFSMQVGLYSEGWNGTKYTVQSQVDDTDYSIWVSILMNCIMISSYFIFYYYLDKTLKNEYGTQKPHCWCMRRKQKIYKDGVLLQSTINGDDEESNIGDFSSAQFHEKLDKQNIQPTVIVRDLLKYFPKLTAVDNLSLSLYPNQIFCLLGHNGAGKTTTISLLTGMIEKSNGQILINKQNLDNNLDEIRKTFGLCLQKDVLYEKMTPEEHLMFIGKIKGRTELQLKQEIDDVIEKCGIQSERKKQIHELSGGNKRKVSLAMALIGDSKIIFLDEPSSGLDPNSRRIIWKILEEVRKEGRTIVLTTHHMEEAEHLADRIGIMAHGKLLTLGTSNFIKKTFGIGYHLKINNKPKESGEQEDLSQEQLGWIAKQVKENVPNVKSNPQAPKGSVVYTLPFDKREYFSNLFMLLESDARLEINLELNSLEDAFVNIGMENEEDDDDDQEQENYTNFDSIQPPESIKNPPSYNFFTQFYPMFTRKISIALTNFQVVISLFLPIFFLIGGLLIAKMIYSFIDNIDEKDPSKKGDTGSPEFWQGMMISGYFVLAFLFNSSTYCGTVAVERDSKLKYALNVMGMKSTPYWIGTFCFDILMYFFICIIFCILLFAFKITSMTENFGELVISFVLFGFCMIWQNYLFSFLFKKGASAFKIIIGINYLFLYLIPLIVVFAINSPVPRKIFSLSTPYITVYFTLLNVISESDLPDAFGIDAFKPFEKMYPYYIGMIVQGVIFAVLTIYFDGKISKVLDQQEITQQEESSYQNTIPEIVSDEQRIQHSRDNVKVQNLYKKYDNGFMAVKNTSLSVDQGQIFGLLGPNGAGKSTTFNILTSLIPKTKGKVTMAGQEITSGNMDIYSQVGITPQFDPLWENLTVRQHMEIFGRVKGLSGQLLEEQIDYYSKVMQLKKYMNFRSKTLSGGNKRKLCVTMALIGGSSIQFFDEPSSGVDPIARRFLWNTLSQSLKTRDSSIVLTTHSMHEAESLCTRIGIQINGRFQCVGTPAELKKKYGEGYNVEIFLKDEDLQNQQFQEKQQSLLQRQQQVIRMIQNKFPQSKLVEDSSKEQGDEKQWKNFMFKLPYENFSFHKTFEFFMNSDIKYLIKDFGISQSSLEQIFLYLSKFQKSSEDAMLEINKQQNNNKVPDQAVRISNNVEMF